jgi:hypothetical protein
MPQCPRQAALQCCAHQIKVPWLSIPCGDLTDLMRQITSPQTSNWQSSSINSDPPVDLTHLIDRTACKAKITCHQSSTWQSILQLISLISCTRADRKAASQRHKWFPCTYYTRSSDEILPGENDQPWPTEQKHHPACPAAPPTSTLNRHTSAVFHKLAGAGACR